MILRDRPSYQIVSSSASKMGSCWHACVIASVLSFSGKRMESKAIVVGVAMEFTRELAIARAEEQAVRRVKEKVARLKHATF